MGNVYSGFGGSLMTPKIYSAFRRLRRFSACVVGRSFLKPSMEGKHLLTGLTKLIKGTGAQGMRTYVTS